MKSLLIQLDDATYKALNRIAPARERRRSEFIREAVRKEIRRAEYAAMKKAYLQQPDSAADADDWSNPEKFEL